MEKKKLNFTNLLLLGFGFFGISLVWPLYNSYVPIFLKDFNLSSTLIGFVMTIDNIFAVFMLPLIGVLSDQTRTKIGRRKPFILIGAPLGALFFALIPLTRNLQILWFMMINIIFMNFFMALFRSPVIALMPDITPSEQRSQANGVINFMGGLGALLAFFAGKPLYDKNFALPFIVGAIILIISQIVVVVFIKEPKEFTVKRMGYDGKKWEKMGEDGVFKKTGKELVENLKDVFKSNEKSLFMILLSILLWFIGYNAFETFFTSYAKFKIGISESTGALILGFFSLTFMIFAIPAGFIGRRFGRKKTMTVGLIGVTVTLFLTFILSNVIPDPKVLVPVLFVVFAFGGASWSLVNVNSLPTVVDMTTSEKVGGYTGLYYFFSMFANIIAPPFAGFFIDIIGYQSLLIFSIVFFILSVITVQFVKRGDVTPA